MTGSVVYQVQTLYKESGICKIGSSKHADKEAFRDGFHKKPTWNEIGQNTAIYSYATADAYREVWISAFEHIKVKFHVRDIEKITGEQAADFLFLKVRERVKLATYKQYASALRKLCVALNLYAEKTGSGNKYDFNESIDAVSGFAVRELERFEGVRSYEAPEEMIENIPDDFHRLVAKIQHDGGARIDEVFGIRKESLQGVELRPFTGKRAGVVTVKGKGGKVRNIYIGVGEYNKLKSLLSEKENNHFDKNRYRNALKKAATATDQKYTGSHGLRWNFAKNRMKDVQRDGKYYEQGLSAVSQEMGHIRADITEHYLRIDNID